MIPPPWYRIKLRRGMGWDVGAKLFRSSSEAVGGSARPRGGYLKQPICLWKILMLLMATQKSGDLNKTSWGWDRWKPIMYRVLRIRGGAGLLRPSTVRPYLEDHPRTSRSLITMVMFNSCPRFGSGCGTGPFQTVIESFMYYFHGGWSDHHWISWNDLKK